MSKAIRIGIASAVFTAAGLGMWAAHESYTSEAIQPVKNDRWTYGYGSTTRPDGSPVEEGDVITPPAALRLIIADLAKKQETLRACFGESVRLYPWEWDSYVDLAGSVGGNAVCKSTIPGKLQAEDFEAACKTILDFKKVQKRDCSLPENKKFCGGVWTRRQETYRLCMTGEYPK
jgi:lysozyme